MSIESYEAFEGSRVAHLDMIQAVVARLGNNGFAVKGWAITVAGAFAGFAITKDNWALALASVVPTTLFWVLDAHFLRAERCFRLLFERVRRGDAAVGPYFMNATSTSFLSALDLAEQKTIGRRTVFWRPALKLLYGSLLVGALIVVAATLPNETTKPEPNCHHGNAPGCGRHP